MLELTLDNRGFSLVKAVEVLEARPTPVRNASVVHPVSKHWHRHLLVIQE